MKTKRATIVQRIACLLVGLVFTAAAHAERIAILSAFDAELESVKRIVGDLQIDETKVINGYRFYLGTAYGKDVVLMQTNVSTVNAAMATQLLLSNFEVSTVLFSGIAGGINPDLIKGDIAIPKKWYYHAEGAYFNESPDDDGTYVLPKGYKPLLKNYGMHFPDYVSVVRSGLSERIEKPYFAADNDLLAIAEKALASYEMVNAAGEQATIKIGGVGVAGPVFMDNRDYRKWLFEVFKADSLDMESTAIAHVCWANHVPFLIIRAMSDLAGGQEGANEIYDFGEAAADNSAEILAAILKAM